MAKQRSQDQQSTSASPISNSSNLPPSQPVPTSDAYMEPAMRLPAMNSQAQQQGDHMELLLNAALNAKNSGISMPPIPTNSSVFQSSGHVVTEFYGHPNGVPNDGFEGELANYMGGEADAYIPAFGSAYM